MNQQAGEKLMHAYVISLAPTDPKVQLLAKLCTNLGYEIISTGSIEDVVRDPQLTRRKDSIVLVPVTDNASSPVASLVQFASNVSGHAFLIYVADNIAPEDYKALVRTGAADCVSWRSAVSEIPDLISRHRTDAAKPLKPAATSGGHNLVIAFAGTNGGVGNTTIVLETGIYLASLKGKSSQSVAAVDLEFQRSMMCEYIDQEPRLKMDELVHDPQRLDDYMLEIFTSKHPSGLNLFACENSNTEYSAVDGAVVFSLLNRVSERYDIVLIDVPSRSAAFMDGVLAHSDFVFVTGRYSVPSIKKIARELTRIRDLGVGPERIGIIINHCETRFFGKSVRKSDIAKALASQRTFYIQEDRSFALDCVNYGESMMQTRPGRGICRDIKKIGEFIRSLAPRAVSSATSLSR